MSVERSEHIFHKYFFLYPEMLINILLCFKKVYKCIVCASMAKKEQSAVWTFCGTSYFRSYDDFTSFCTNEKKKSHQKSQLSKTFVVVDHGIE